MSCEADGGSFSFPSISNVKLCITNTNTKHKYKKCRYEYTYKNTTMAAPSLSPLSNVKHTICKRITEYSFAHKISKHRFSCKARTVPLFPGMFCVALLLAVLLSLWKCGFLSRFPGERTAFVWGISGEGGG